MNDREMKLIDALDETDFSVTESAVILGVSKQAVSQKLRKMGICIRRPLVESEIRYMLDNPHEAEISISVLREKARAIGIDFSRRAFTDEDLIDALDRGDLRQSKAAKILGVSVYTVHYHCRRLWICFKEYKHTKGSRRFTDEELIDALDKSGLSQTEAARLLGVHFGTVHIRCKAMCLRFTKYE